MHDANLPKMEKCLKNGCFDEKIKNFDKSKIDGLIKLPTRACLFYDFLHFKGCPYVNQFFPGKGGIVRF